MGLNKQHSLLRRLSDDNVILLTKFLSESRNADALKELFDVALVETHVSPDDNNWLIKRARIDGQESMLKTLKELIKD